jgi:hypothetical protein
MPVKYRQRKSIRSSLKNEGSHLRNLKTLKEQKGFLIMAHGIVKYSQELKYGHCLNCFGYYSRKSYARHRCITNKKSAKDLKRKATPIKEGDAALQLKHVICYIYNCVLNHPPPASRLVRGDLLARGVGGGGK